MLVAIMIAFAAGTLFGWRLPYLLAALRGYPAEPDATRSGPLSDLSVNIVVVTALLAALGLTFATSYQQRAPDEPFGVWFSSYLQNTSTEVIGLVITFFLFEQVIARRNRAQEREREAREKQLDDEREARRRQDEADRADQAFKDDLVRRAGSIANTFAVDAVEELRKRGLLGVEDGDESLLAGADLSRASLEKAYLVRANLEGTQLEEANLSAADLERANLSAANLSGANLSDANLSGANLSDAYLWNANLSDAYLTEANLSDANLVAANLSAANLWNANLSAANLMSANLSAANLWSAKLSAATLQYANLSAATLQYANLSDATLQSAKLSDANLVDAKLSAANLQYANLSAANLYRANLSAANLMSANLSAANLVDANLSAANLVDAKLSAADLLFANLRAANLMSANLTGAKNIANARFNDKTVLPDARPQRDESGEVIEDEDDNVLYTAESYWNTDTDMLRYTDPNHPDYWLPDWAAAGFETRMDWFRAGEPRPWREAGYGGDHMAWVRAGKPGPLPIDDPKAWWEEWRAAGFEMWVDWFDADYPRPWREAGYGGDHMAWLRAGKPVRKPADEA